MSEPKGKSLDEIAAMLAQNTMQARGITTDEVTDQDTPDDGDVADGDSKPAAVNAVHDDVGVETDDVVALAEDADGDEAAADDNQGDEEETSQSPTAVDDDDEFEIDDDTLFAIDDETNVSFADLKSLYVNNKDNAENLKVTAEATQEAITTRARAQADSEKAAAAAQMLFTHLIGVAEAPLISAPDPALKQQDPAQYIAHLEAYQADQDRIKEAKQTLENAMAEHVKTSEENKANRKAHEMQVLHTKIPALRSEDQKVKAQAAQDILDAAGHYGFSPEEVNEAIDHRVYQMAYDAQQYRKLMAQGEKKTTLEEIAQDKVKTQTRTLRSRGTSAKNRLSSKAKKVKVLRSKAQKSGSVDDVAAFIAGNSSQG